MLFTFSPWMYQNTDTAFLLNCTNERKVYFGCACVRDVCGKGEGEANGRFMFLRRPQFPFEESCSVLWPFS